MRPEVWQEVLEIWPQVLDRPEDQRRAFLRQVCGRRDDLLSELESLLAAEPNSGTFLEKPILARGLPPPEITDPNHWIGCHLGPYRLTQILGQGGMGTVYLGSRVDGELEQEVAIKIIRGNWKGTALEDRFRAERQILSRLQHPYIARLLDAGTAPEGSPYEVMEYVSGVPITAYCERHRLAARECVELLAKVCAAVETVHAEKIVHRDLKPANILVTDSGDPKLLDFGVSKLLDQPLGNGAAATAMPMMTPTYASPEQLGERAVTPASDVYSLGVLLYRLLTDRLPFDWLGKSPIAIEREMAKGPPSPPSQAIPQEEGGEAIDEDLDRIVLKALESEPARRYQDAGELQRDLDRYLDQQPVEAGPPDRPPRLIRRLARNRFALLAAISLAALLGALGWQTIRRSDQGHAADELRQQADEMVRFLETTFKEADPYQGSESLEQMRRTLETHTERVLTEMAGQPALQGRLLGTLGTIHQNLGLYERATDLLDQSLALRLAAHGPNHPEVATAKKDQAWLLLERGQLDEAQLLLQQTLAIEQRIQPEDLLGQSITLNRLGILEHKQGDYEAAEQWLRQAIAIRRPAKKPDLLSDSLHNLSMALFAQSRLDEAEAAANEAIGLSTVAMGADSLSVAKSQTLLADIADKKGDHSRAIQLLESSLEVMREKLGGKHPTCAIVLNNLGNNYGAVKKNAAATAAYEEALDIHRSVFGNSHPEVAITLSNLAAFLRQQVELEDSETYYWEAVAIFHEVYGRDHPTTAFVTVGLARVLRMRGFPTKAETFARQSLETLEQQFGEDSPKLASALLTLGMTRQDQGDFAEARRYLQRAFAIQAAVHGTDHWKTGHLRYRLADLLFHQDRLVEAEDAFRQLRATLDDAPEHQALLRHRIDLDLADLLLRAGRPFEAEPLLESSQRALAGLLPATHPILSVGRSIEGMARTIRGDRETAAALLKDSYTELRHTLSPHSPLARQALWRMEQAEGLAARNKSRAEPRTAPAG